MIMCSLKLKGKRISTYQLKSMLDPLKFLRNFLSVFDLKLKFDCLMTDRCAMGGVKDMVLVTRTISPGKYSSI